MATGSRMGIWSVLLLGSSLAGPAGAETIRLTSNDTPESARILPAGEAKRSVYGAYLAGKSAANAKDLGVAADLLTLALAADPENPDILRAAFQAVTAEGRMTESVALAERLVRQGTQTPLANVVLAIDDARAGRLLEAETRIAGLPRSGINNLMLPLMRGWIAAGRGDAAGAAQALRPLGEISSFAQLHDLHAAMIADFMGDKAKASERYQEVVGGSVQSYRVVVLAGGYFERNGDPARAKALYDQLAERSGDATMLAAAYARLDGRKPPPAPVGSVTEGLAEAFFDMAVIGQRERPGTELALVFDRLAVSLKPDFPIAQMLLGEILEGQNRDRDAIAAYTAIPKESPFDWSARLRRAAVRDELGETDAAAAELKAMASERPEREDPLVRLGDILRQKERYAEAIEAYDAAFARVQKPEKRHWSMFFSRGIALERSKQWQKSEVDLKRALELEPDQPYVLNYLGYTWVDQGVNIEQAKKMIERAVELRPQDGHIVDSLGWAYYRLGDFAQATTQLERAIELRPQDATINDHLGDAYWQVGRKAEARFQWRRALSLGPDEDLRKQIEEKLEKGLVATGPTPAK